MRRRIALGAGLFALVIAATPVVARASLPPACAASDWPMFGHDIGRSFASPDHCISNVTAAGLAPSWFFNTQSPVTAQPVVAGGVVFAGDFAGIFHALVASPKTATGAEL